MTPDRRLKASQHLFRRLLRRLLPMRGRPVTPALLDQVAARTIAEILAARAVYQRFAVNSYQDAVRQPIATPPIREYVRADWRSALDKVARIDTPNALPIVSDQFMERTLTRADLHARNAERNQTIAFAVHDPDQVEGWARIDRVPPTCPLCRITISRGPVYSSKDAAGGDGNDYHVGCTCETVLVLKGQKDSWPGIEFYRRELKFYKDSVKGASNAAKAYRAAVNADNARQEGTVQKAAERAVNSERKES